MDELIETSVGTWTATTYECRQKKPKEKQRTVIDRKGALLAWY